MLFSILKALKCSENCLTHQSKKKNPLCSNHRAKAYAPISLNAVLKRCALA